ncbi:MAG: DUF5698 domain-containing protein [Candidatus Omnitrophota bacterium]
MILNAIKIFIVGALESFFSAFNTKTIQKNRQILSFIVSVISILLWYYVIVIVVENLHHVWLILIYGCGNGIGDILSIRFDRWLERFSKVGKRRRRNPNLLAWNKWKKRLRRILLMIFLSK